MADSLVFYTIAEVASILKVTERTIYNYIKMGSLKAAKIGKNWRVRVIDLKEFVNASIVNN